MGAVRGRAEVTQLDGGGQHRDEGLCVFGPGMGLLFCEEFPDSRHTVFPGQAESTTVLQCISLSLRLSEARPASRQRGGHLGVCELLGEGHDLVLVVLPDRFRAERAGLLRPATQEGLVSRVLLGGGSLLLLLEIELCCWGAVLMIILMIDLRCWGGKH